jgi:hypothetical protein
VRTASSVANIINVVCDNIRVDWSMQDGVWFPAWAEAKNNMVLMHCGPITRTVNPIPEEDDLLLSKLEYMLRKVRDDHSCRAAYKGLL